MSPIDGPLDAAIDAWTARTATGRRSRSAYRGHRRRALADPSAHPLRRRRLTFRGDGIDVQTLSERSTVAPSVIHAIEQGRETGSDRTWQRLSLALSVERHVIDPSCIKA